MAWLDPAIQGPRGKAYHNVSLARRDHNEPQAPTQSGADSFCLITVASLSSHFDGVGRRALELAAHRDPIGLHHCVAQLIGRG